MMFHAPVSKLESMYVSTAMFGTLISVAYLGQGGNSLIQVRYLLLTDLVCHSLSIVFLDNFFAPDPIDLSQLESFIFRYKEINDRNNIRK